MARTAPRPAPNLTMLRAAMAGRSSTGRVVVMATAVGLLALSALSLAIVVDDSSPDPRAFALHAARPPSRPSRPAAPEATTSAAFDHLADAAAAREHHWRRPAAAGASSSMLDVDWIEEADATELAWLLDPDRAEAEARLREWLFVEPSSLPVAPNSEHAAPDSDAAFCPRSTCADPIRTVAEEIERRRANAVRHALLWLRDHQLEDGGWSFTEFAAAADSRREGRYTSLNGVAEPTDATDDRLCATALAVLAFNAANVTHQEGEFCSTVKRGLVWLRKTMPLDGAVDGATRGTATRPALGLALRAAVFATSANMTGSAVLRSLRDASVRALCAAQNVRDGAADGWGDAPGDGRSNALVTGWAVLALGRALKGEPEPELRAEIMAALYGGLKFLARQTTISADGRWSTGFADEPTGHHEPPGGAANAENWLSALFVAQQYVNAARFETDDALAAARARSLDSASVPAADPSSTAFDPQGWVWKLELCGADGRCDERFARAVSESCRGMQRADVNRALASNGSWDPSRVGEFRGRVGMTALATMALATSERQAEASSRDDE